MRIDVYHHFPKVDSTLSGKLDQVLHQLATQGATMSALSDAVDALVGRVTEDTDHLLQLIADGQAREVALQSSLDAALANDAADAQAIADAQAAAADAGAARDAALEDATATVARLQAIDPVADFPAVEPPVE